MKVIFTLFFLGLLNMLAIITFRSNEQLMEVLKPSLGFWWSALIGAVLYDLVRHK